MTTNVKKLNKLVIAFLGENSDAENIEELWMESTLQKKVRNLCSRHSEHGRKKDPNAPKRGKSSYLFYCADFRDQVKKDLGVESKATDVTRELGVRWNIMKSSKKSGDKKALLKYESAAKEDRERYEKDKESYVQPEDEYNTRRGGKKNINNGPKRAKSVYLYFCEKYRDQVRSSNPNLKATEVTSKLGSMWNELKADKSRLSEMAALTVQADADKSRYENEKKALNTPVVDSSEKTVEEPKDNSSKKGKGSDNGKVSGKEQNGFQLFCAEKRVELKSSNPKAKASEITKKLSASWKELSKEEKNKWSSVSVK